MLYGGIVVAVWGQNFRKRMKNPNFTSTLYVQMPVEHSVNRFLTVKAQVCTFYKEKALVEAFSRHCVSENPVDSCSHVVGYSRCSCVDGIWLEHDVTSHHSCPMIYGGRTAAR